MPRPVAAARRVARQWQANSIFPRNHAFSPRPLRHAQGVSSKRIATFLKGRFPHRHQTVQTGEGTDERQTLPLRHQAHPEHARTAARRQPGAVGPGGVADAPSKAGEGPLTLSTCLTRTCMAATARRCRCRSPRGRCYPQQGFCCWIGGHGTVPYEQNTQQSPCLGRSTAPQPGHS